MSRSLLILALVAALGGWLILSLVGTGQSAGQSAGQLVEAGGPEAAPPVRRTAATAEEAVPETAPSQASERTSGAPEARNDEAGSRTATVDVRVVLRGTGEAIPGCVITVYDDLLREVRADADGRAVVPVTPGQVNLIATVGQQEGHDMLLALPYDPDTGEPAADQYVTVAAGETAQVTLEVQRAGSITGTVLDAEGAPVPKFPFVSMGAVRSSWGRPSTITTDEAGRFDLGKLTENWYLLAPDPKGDDVFPFEKLHLTFGERKSVTITLAPSQRVAIPLRLVQKRTDEPYPFPVATYLVRADGVAEVAMDRLERWRWQGRVNTSPIEIKASVRPARYRVTIDGPAGTMDAPGYWVCDRWSVAHYFDVTDEFEIPEATVEVPRLGPIAHLRVHFTRPMRKGWDLRAMKRGPDGGSSVASYLRSGLQLSDELELFVDLDHLTDGYLSFVEVRNGESLVVAEIVLQEGEQELSITPGAD